MTGWSIRMRLTAWYMSILALAALALGGASWYLASQSVRNAADAGLRARVHGVQEFLENPETRMNIEGLRDEFAEYAELTRGEALLEVVDGAGTVLCRPAIRGWEHTANGLPTPQPPSDVRPVDRLLGDLPFRVASARIVVWGRAYQVTVAAPMGPAYEALRQFRRLLLLVLPLVLVLAGVGGYWVSRKALAPVDRMTREVQSMTVQRLDQRVEVPRADDELRRLAVTFNAMLGRLQAAVSDIVRFTGDASHELRTPVALVRTTAEIALRHERTPLEYEHALRDVLAYSQRMSTLVEDLLMLARADAGIEPRDDAQAEIVDIVGRTQTELMPAARTRGVAVQVALPDGPLLVHGDAGSLTRLLSIVLDNAIKYTRPNGHVVVEVLVAPDDAAAVVVEITDTGIGLDPADMPRLFERFYRGTRARQHAPDGSGLGLSLAQRIVERHGGSMTIEPIADAATQGGCRVRIRLRAVVDTCDILAPQQPMGVA